MPLTMPSPADAARPHFLAAGRALRRSAVHLAGAMRAAWRAWRDAIAMARALDELARLERHRLVDLGLSESDILSLRRRAAGRGLRRDADSALDRLALPGRGTPA